MIKTKTLNSKQQVVVKNKNLCSNYVLEYSTQAFVEEQGIGMLQTLQNLLQSPTQLTKICKYVYCDEMDCFSSEYYVVYTNGYYYLINLATTKIKLLAFNNINTVHKFVFGLMSE